MPDKGELESHREETFIDDIIQKSHIEKELLSHLDGIKVSAKYPNGVTKSYLSFIMDSKECKRFTLYICIL